MNKELPADNFVELEQRGSIRKKSHQCFFLNWEQSRFLEVKYDSNLREVF